jgi:hypothetical protein
MLKATVIGGGSTYTSELINGFLERTDAFPVDELWLMDISPERLEIVGGFAQRIVEARGAPFAVHLTTDQRESIRGASYVITQLHVGGMAARREDEYLGRRHGQGIAHHARDLRNPDRGGRCPRRPQSHLRSAARVFRGCNTLSNQVLIYAAKH